MANNNHSFTCIRRVEIWKLGGKIQNHDDDSEDKDRSAIGGKVMISDAGRESTLVA